MHDDKRRLWAQACTRIAVIAGVFSLVLGGLLAVNSFSLHRGPGNGKLRLVEAGELRPLKAALREDPKNEALQRKIRELDQQLRHDYFRRERLASRGGWLLAVGAAVFLAALHLASRLKRPPFAMPKIFTRREDPVRTSALAAKAVAGSALGLAGLTIALVWDTGRQWQETLTEKPAASARPPAVDATWFPSDEEIAANWPRFRGPGGSGITTLTDIPETWNGGTGENVLWKTAIDLPGENSPVVWGDRVYLSGATEKERAVYGIDSRSGSLLWKKTVGTPQSARSEPPEVMEDTGYAAPGTVTDGRRVFAIFANGDIAGFTSEGESLWVRSLGTPENMYGHAASLDMWRNLVIVVFDQADAEAGKSKILALDAATGTPVWSTPRPVANSWVSPIVIRHGGRDQIITAADPWVIAYDPATGKELWKAECVSGDVAPTPVLANGLVYIASDQDCIAAINPEGSGDITQTGIVWRQEDTTLPDMCSLLCDGPRLYTLVFGVLRAFDALTGKLLWEFETDAKFEASPTLVNGRIHLLTDEGVAIIGVADNDGFKETGRATLGEGVGASPAFLPGRMFLRGKDHLFCIGKKDGN